MPLIIGSEKWEKKRGYFFGGFEKKLAEKYNISPAVVNQLRKDVIYHKKPYSDIFVHYADKAYKSANETPPNTNTLATKITTFLKTATTEQLDDITRITKFDRDFNCDLTGEESTQS